MGNELPNPTAMELLKAKQAELDGVFALSQAETPMNADDVGDTDIDANPRACDLEYEDPSVAVMQKQDDGEMKTFHDGPNVVLAGERYICVNENSLVKDITNWA